MRIRQEIHKHWLLPLIFATSLIVLAIDALTPIGTADYIFYFIPVALTVFHYRPSIPLYIALLVTLLSIVGFFISPEGITMNVARNNRIYATITLWIVAYLVRQILITKAKNDRESWLKNGATLLAENIRGELNAKELIDRVLIFYSQYVEVQIATAYIKKEQSKVIEWITGYAAPSDLKKSFEYGEGILGQCVQNQKAILLSPVPENYIKLSSSLGQERPRAIFAIPLLADNLVVGAIELGFLTTPSELVLEFINQSTEAISIGLRSALHKSRLSELLYQAQQMTEELQAQQEELRVSNEELEQQSRALKENHVRLENQQVELEQSNQQLEEQTQSLVHQKSLLDEKNSMLLETQSILQQKAREIERSSQYKSEFLANMSHELRTPLNSSLILAKLLSDNKSGNLTEEQIKYAQIIHTSGNDLLNLINDILDLSKVEAGKLNINPEKIELASLSSSLEASFSEQAKLKKLEFKVSIDQNVPEDVITDRQRLEQILKNFISNALKFTEKGFVHVHISKILQGIRFSISDSGIGISKEQQEVIFEAFRQADGTTNRKYGGTGLGLSISRQLAKLLSGEIQVKSTLGQGSTFIFDLFSDSQNSILPQKEVKVPIIQNTSLIPKDKNAPIVSTFSFKDDREHIADYSRKILIIEDDESFAKILFDLSHEMNFGALTASSAEEGLKLAQTFSPHAILLDVRLPDYSGLLVLDQLKMNSSTRHIPVHVISSSDFTKSALEMGAIGYMLKPVKREELLDAFNNFTAHMSQALKHVLIVEDEPIQREHITKLISDSNILVDSVENAKDALTHLAEKTYDCMIMDLSLPDLSGYELLSKMSQENSTYSYPPVIIYTARDLTTEEEEKLRLYSGSIIIKGARSPERLLSEVTLFIHKVETELPLERQKILRDLRTREKTLEDRNILIVDDDVRNIFALTSALESYGAKISFARNGIEAIEKVNQMPKLDLVLMDIMMPEMDGHEATQRLRKTHPKLPIIALTAKAMKDDHEKSLAAGASDYLSKPIDIEKLVSLMRVWLPTNRGFIN